MSVHYKFKSALDFDTVTFDGLNISVGDLKRSIVHQKRLGKVTDFDLQITNAQTKEEYQDDAVLIPKNTSLIIARIPISQPKKSWNPQNTEKLQTTRAPTRTDGTSLDLSKMKGTEEDKILEMMIQSTADYDPKSYHRLRGHSQVGEVPPTYRCNRCKKSGHWIKNCPFTLGKEHMEVKRNTGIPRSFLEKDDKEGAASFPEPAPTVEDKKEIPEDLVCSICKDLFVDAVMIPCCGSSFCDDCVRTALLESEDNECPDCKEKGCSPGSLIPNRFLRNSVNAFKNENGYTTTTKVKKAVEKEDKVESGGSSLAKVKPDTTDLNPMDEKSTPTDEIPLKDQDKDKHDEKSVEVISADSNPKTESSKVDEVESDYEDNITIMMPPVSLKSSSGVSSDQSYSGRNVNHPKPPGIENSPHRAMQVPSLDIPKDNHSTLDSQKNDWEHEHKSERDYSEEDSNGNVYYKNSCPKPHNPPINAQMHFANKMQIRPPRPNHLMDVYSGPPNRVNAYQQIPSHLPLVQDPSVQGPSMMPFVNVYNQMGPRPNVGYQHSVRPIFHNPTSGFPPMRCPPAELHHANSNLASVYQGVAAKVGTGIIEDPLETFNRLMKEKERRREERRRSMERRRSWSHERQVRSRNHNSPYRRTGRELKEKPRLHESDRKRENVFDRNKPMRRRRSNSFSDRSSRSRSWSNSSLKKRSRSPYSKRSRSRTNMFIEKRDMGKSHGMRNDDELRKDSPPAGLRRSTSEERSRLLRHNHPDWYSHQAHPMGNFDSYRYQKRERFQESLPETLEPPPPGYETNQGSYSSNYVAQPIKRINTQDGKDRKINDSSRIAEKSEPKVVNKLAERKRRSSRSKSPPPRKPTSNSDRLEKRSGKRSRIQSSSQRGSDRSKEEEHKKIDVISSEAKRHYEKNTEKSGTKSRNDSKEREINRDRSEKPIFTEHAVTPERTNTNNIIVSKDDEVKSNKQEDKTLKKLKDKDRKKKRKDKSERKKVKKDKKGKRDKEKQKISDKYEQKQGEDVDISRTPEINSYENSTVIEQLITNKEDKEEIDLAPANEVPALKIDSENVLVKPKNDPAPEADFKRLDSVLDINDYEMEFDELSTQNQKSKVIAPIPELSKWELDEQNNSVSQVVNMDSAVKPIHVEKDVNNEKVTNEVLRKAENAIFARAIKAIYPIEKTESKVDHHSRIYSETIPRMSSKDNIKNFEITIPVSNSQERSVQIKDSNRNKSQSPKIIKSVKERLGSKVTNKGNSSPNRDIASKLLPKIHPIGRNASERDEERNRSKPKERERDKNYRNPTLSVRDRNRERDWEREKDQERERDRERDREKERDRERYRERERERVRNRDRERDTERGRERDHERDTERGRERDHERDNDRGRERDQDRFRERDRDRNRERDNDYKPSKLPSRDGEMYGRNRPYFKERIEGNSLTRTIRNNKESTFDSHNKDKIRLDRNKRSHEDLRQVNESDVERERNKHRNNQNNCSSKERNTDEGEDLKSDFNEKEANLKSHIASTCSSSGSANSSSDSESDDAKRKRKHKCKKDKKHSKRSLSADSRDSSKERHVKNKKRNKSSKKKKKNKK